MQINILYLVIFISVFLSSALSADPADVLNVNVTNHGDDRYSFNVTVQHNDTGWDHYADAWVIFTEDGKYLGARNLQHPHLDEQPFTRNLPYIHITRDIKIIVIRAHCSQDKFGGAEVTVTLPDNTHAK